MKKKIKVMITIIVMALLFCSGYCSALHFNKGNKEETGKGQKADEVREQQETADTNPAAEKREEEEKAEPPAGEEKEKAGETVVTAGNGGWMEKEDTWSREFEELLEEHVFGDWRFSRRIGVVDDGWVTSADDIPGHKVDFSEQGVEEMKGIVVHYGRDSAGVARGIDQETFTDPADMELFGTAGGFGGVIRPSYALGEWEGRYHWHEVVEDCPPAEELVPVCYAGRNAVWEELPRNNMYDIYVDPGDTDTLYLDFCGLWEMKREKKELPAMDVQCVPDLTDGERKFIEEHVCGKWKFNARLYQLEESECGNTGMPDNFSDQGVAELISGKGSFILFNEGFGSIDFEQTALSSPGDVYLCFVYSRGFMQNEWHVWGEVDAGNIRVRNAFREEDDYVSLEGKDRLVEITCDRGAVKSTYGDNGRCHEYHVHHLYADPGDTDTLYLDLCGLWELKRVVE